MCNEEKIGHPHAALMLLYAQDATTLHMPWTLWEYKARNGDWRYLVTHPSWDRDTEYRRKPHTITINGIEVPEPCYNPASGSEVWYIALSTDGKVCGMTYNGTTFDRMITARGLVHLTEAAALCHARALLSFTEK